MNLVKRHPEAHDAWLYAMGIDVRWRHRSSLTEDASVGVPMIELPECIAQARYWIIGEQVLTDVQAYLLASMMWAIGVENVADCVYSYREDVTQTAPILVVTGLSALPSLRTITIESNLLQAPVDAIENITLIILGDTPMAGQTHERLLRVPNLQDMIDNPDLKKNAWAVLKSRRISSI